VIVAKAPRRHALAAAAVMGGAAFAALTGANVAGLRFNGTASMPMGLWRVTDNHAPLRRGEIVTVCPPDTRQVQEGSTRGYIPPGSCPGDYEPLVKPVAAIAGDVVAVSPAAVRVNGRLLPNTAQLAQDSAGRALRPFPVGTYRVASGEVWLLSGHDRRSFDSRYFGPVPEADVQGIARPVWTLR
jgi:conjugative transfer signal peptidase TraF